jgi:hypothetical protein
MRADRRDLPIRLRRLRRTGMSEGTPIPGGHVGQRDDIEAEGLLLYRALREEARVRVEGMIRAGML